MWRRIAILAAMANLVLLAGCPATGTDGGDGQDTTGATSLVGTWSGSIECSRTESLNGGTPGSPVRTTIALTITFGADGFPDEILIMGYSNTPDAGAAVARTGDTDTIESTAGSADVTDVVTVSKATYTATSVRLEIDIDHTGSGGNLALDGTGQQVVEITLNNDGSLDYSATTTYDVQQTAGAVSFDTASDETCTGTLTRQ